MGMEYLFPERPAIYMYLEVQELLCRVVLVDNSSDGLVCVYPNPGLQSDSTLTLHVIFMILVSLFFLRSSLRS